MNAFQGPMKPFPGLEQWSRQVQLPGSKINLHIYDTGETSQPPVMLLHGLGDEADTWRHVLPLIQPGYRVIAPDLPGFGSSDKPRRSYTISFYEETVLELLDYLSFNRAVIAGHSNGAVIAQAFALAHPERVARLVLISGTLVSKENHLNPGLLLFLIPGVGEWLYNRLRKNPQAAYRSLKPYYHQMENLPQADRNFLNQRVNERVWSESQRRAFLSTLRNLVRWLPSQQKGLPDRLRGWTVPTTVIWGEDDRVNPIANAYALKQMLPSARLVVVPGAGHNVQQEKPEVVAAAISQINSSQTSGSLL